ncbi:Catenin alpha-2 [Ilyodon furcidens]|uniref:Catenin alpha-2 n=1 Tax=Ilyodon furcidens TaxID=33524 RepID=A0ABV0SQQ1_9TELE
MSGITSDAFVFLCHLQAIMAQLPQEEKAKIAEQVESFRQEKCKLDAEVAKWDDNGNDIIVLAKQMCMIMMEMTDFTRGKGPLKNSSDVINAAKKIAEAGSRMDKLSRAVADQNERREPEKAWGSETQSTVDKYRREREAMPYLTEGYKLEDV